MSDVIRGMVVYHRKDYRCGKVTAGNQFTGMIAVQWDNGDKQILNVQELMSEKLYNEIKEEERVNSMVLKNEEAVVGAVVYEVGTTAPLRKGKIVGPLDNTHGNNLVIVEWSDGTLDKRQIRTLLSEVVGLAEAQRLQDEQDRLEQEFATIESAVKEKLADAAKLINEAAALANKGNVDILDMYDATRALERAMDNAGWNTSSWHC